MLIRSALIVVLAIVVPGASVHGQPAPSTGNDLIAVCESLAFGGAELVFAGRAQPPVTVRISGETEIEQARVNLVRIEAEVQRLRASLDPQTMLEHEAELATRLAEARDELGRQRLSHPPPVNVTFVPVHVEHVFRGVTAPILMLRSLPHVTKLEPGALYLIAGHRDNALRGMTGLDIVTVGSATDAESAAREVRLLESNISSATILGRLQMNPYGDLRAPLGDVRIRVSSGTRVVETVTGDDGSFTVSGIQFGRVEVRPLLRQDLTVVNKSALTIEIREGGCRTVHLTAALNGRVRGRIVSASGTSLDGVVLVLQGVDSSGRMSGSHQPLTSVRPNEDGTFEFSGQVPGSYVLSAGLERVENGKKRRLTTYFPGTADRSAAVPIVVGKATQHPGFDFLVITE